MHHPMTSDFMVTDERCLVGEVKVQAASAIDGATVIGERFVRCQNMCEVDIVSTLCFHLTCQVETMSTSHIFCKLFQILYQCTFLCKQV